MAAAVIVRPSQGDLARTLYYVDSTRHDDNEVIMVRFPFAAIAAIVAMVPACTVPVDSGHEPRDEAEDELFPAGAPTSRTGLSPYCFWHDNTQLTLREYGAQPLLNESGLLRAPHFLPSGCDEVPAYVIGCALPMGERVEVASGEVFEGRFGLAPDWLESRLTGDAQRLITACLLQHLSSEDEVPFALEGRSSALAGALPASQPESIIGGNLFMGGTAPIGAAAFQAFACVDAGIEETCSGVAGDALRARICGKSAICGLEIVGSCQDVCDLDDDGRIVGCHGDMTNEALRMWIDRAALSSLHRESCN